MLLLAVVVAALRPCGGLVPPRPPRFGGLGASAAGDDGSARRWLGVPLALGQRKKLVRGTVALAAVGAASSRPVRRSARFECGLARIAWAYGRFLAESRLLPGGVGRFERLEDVHEFTALRLEQLVVDMKGAYVKSAQLISTAFPELLPAAWVARLETMVDDAPARPWASTKRVLEAELGAPYSTFFSRFDEAPVGAASIGQVHRAVVRETNETVAVKVMFPGGRRLILSDLANVRRVLRVLKPALLPAVDEFRARVAGEFDYVEEAARMDACAAFVSSRRSLRRRVTIPTSKRDLTTTRVLTMDWLEGKSLRDDLEGRLADAEATRFGPLRLWKLLRLRSAAAAALDAVSRAQGAMIFGASAGFSADPHPGNIMVLGDGRLALIDYGCFQSFNETERRTLADLYVALDRGDGPTVVETIKHMGFVSKHMNETLIKTFATQCFDTDVTDESPYMFLASMEKYDTVISIPKKYMLVTRVSLLLRGLGAKVGCGRLSMARLWRHEARAARRSLPPRTTPT